MGTSKSKDCSGCQSNPCCCPNVEIENNPTNTNNNTFNPVITVNPIFNFPPSNGNSGNVTVTSGPIFRNANTDFIAVSVLNFSDSPQTVTVSVIDWQNTCDEEEYPKYGFLCGEMVVPDTDTDTTPLLPTPVPDIFSPPDLQGVLTPLTFTIPARQLFTVQAFPPNPMHPPNPCYEVRVTVPPQPIFPPNPTTPPAPIRINTWGISFAGVIQEGDTVLHHQFTEFPGDPV